MMWLILWKISEIEKNKGINNMLQDKSKEHSTRFSKDSDWAS
jgi:hypothetical protein